jgi:hypothetical protein
MPPKLQIILQQLAGALGVPVPPVTMSDPVVPGGVPFDQVLGALGLAANSGDPADNAQAQAGHDERQLKVNDALTKFPANEEQSAAKLAAAGGDPTQMVQSVPQIAAGIAGGLAGAISGALQPFTQLAQQGAQAGQQALQAGMGALQHGAEGGAVAAGTLPEELLGAESGLGAGAGDLAGAAGAGGGGGLGGGTTPAAMLGPPPTPSAGTVPASSPTTPPLPPAPAESTAAPRGPMGAMPMVPPMMQGAGPTGNDGKTDTKRVVAPSVKNGAPVQGRITTPPTPPEVIKRVEGKPVATRRILAPDHKPDDDAADPAR